MSTRSETSRINGAKSHGPTTDEGRRAVSLNAVKHGLTAETVVLANESPEEYEAELQAYLQRFALVDKPETDLVHPLAAAHSSLALLNPLPGPPAPRISTDPQVPAAVTSAPPCPTPITKRTQTAHRNQIAKRTQSARRAKLQNEPNEPLTRATLEES